MSSTDRPLSPGAVPAPEPATGAGTQLPFQFAGTPLTTDTPLVGDRIRARCPHCRCRRVRDSYTTSRCPDCRRGYTLNPKDPNV